MDFSLITGAVASINAAKELGKAALAVRDFNETAAAISNINAELLKAQDSLFAHNAQLLALQQQYFEATQELAEVREALAEKKRYTLFEFTRGSFAYRSDTQPTRTHGGDPVAAEPQHYICQHCFDGPDHRKAVLRFNPMVHWYPACWVCPVCDSKLYPREG